MNIQSLSVVVPVFNEKDAVEPFLIQLRQALDVIGKPYEVIVVDDGSRDGTQEALRGVSWVRVIQHQVNRGYGSAIKTGVARALYDAVLIIDADGTYPVDRIADLVDVAPECDMVVGARTGARVYQSRLKKVAKWPINRLADYLVDFRIPDLNSGLRIFRKDLFLQNRGVLPNGFSLTTNITLALLSDGYQVHYISIDYHKRTGHSKVHPFRDALNYFLLVVRMILFYNPLKVFVPLAGIFFTATVVSLAYDVTILQDLTQKSLILFIASVQISIMGLLADLINKRGK